MNAVSFGVGIGLFLNASTDREMLGGLLVMLMAGAIEAAERHGTRRRAAMREAQASAVSE